MTQPDPDLRDRIAAAVQRCAEEGNVRYGHIADAVLAVLPAPDNRAAVLSDAERAMLTYALDQAQEQIWVGDGFTVEDQAALDSLRRLAGEAQQDEAVVTVHAAPNLSPEAAEALGALVDVAKEQVACDFDHPHPEHPCGRRISEAQDEAPGPWLVQKICCGRDDGTPEFATWEAADQFREEYIDSARIAGHERTAIVRAKGSEAQQDAAPGGCPTACDPDCEAACHETHQIPARRDHQPEQCAAVARSGQPETDEEAPVDPWEVSYHQLTPARLNPGVCICGLGPDAVVHNEPRHEVSYRLRAAHHVPVAGLCTLCHHHETATCHTNAPAD